MEQVFFAENAAIVRATFPISLDSINLEELTSRGAGYVERIFAVAVLALAAPVIFCLALLIKLTSKGPVFYKQVRVGKEGKDFTLYKLRSMIQNAEAATGPVLSWKGDSRVTKFGNFLRKTHLDELPQLFNMARGEMSLLGPRPERPEFVEKFRDAIPRYSLRLKTKPGITGLAQICCGYDASPEEKLEYDLVYIRNKHDVRMVGFILYRTFTKVLFQH